MTYLIMNRFINVLLFNIQRLFCTVGLFGTKPKPLKKSCHIVRYNIIC